MYYELEDKLVVTSSTGQYSRAVETNGDNGVAFEFTVFDIEAEAQVDAQLQESNDLENWDDVTGIVESRTTVGYSDKVTGAIIASQFVRLKFTLDQGNAAVVAAGINTANL